MIEENSMINVADLSFERKFSTECFFMTMQAQYEGLSPGLRHYTDLQRQISFLDRQYKQLEREAENFGPDQQRQKLRTTTKLANMLKTRSVCF